jgi:hypothetical protein
MHRCLPLTIGTGSAESFSIPGLAGAARPDARLGNQQNKTLRCNFSGRAFRFIHRADGTDDNPRF